MRIRTILICGLLLAGPARPGAGQEALVLSGGGSRGLAHAGVFLGLEELGYDPDLVVGTSMGALMGALYAAGYEPGEIRERVLAIDWSDTFTPTPVVIGPERTVRYPMLNLDLDVDRLRFSRGVVAQWRINRTLARLLFDANARSRGDFDRLARRYRAVATDLRTGDAVVLEEGDLARAARASMAVPGFFAPVVWGDHVLVDGGIADNLPTGVAQRMGADRVIAVDVTRRTEEIEARTPLGVLERALDLMLENAQRDDSAPPDALVVPEIDPRFSGANFPEDAAPLVRTGLEATLRDLPASPPEVGRGERPLPAPPDSFARLVLEAPDPALAALARRAFAGAARGAYDAEAVLDAMDRLYTTGLFEGIWPRVVEDPDTAPGAALVVRLDAPPQISLSAAAGYENDRGARAWATLQRYTGLGRMPTVLGASASLDGLGRWAALSARVYSVRWPGVAYSIGSYAQERDVRTFLEDGLATRDALRAGAWVGLELPHILRDRFGTAVLRAEWVDVEEGRRGASFGPLLRYTSLNPEVLVVGEPFLLEGEFRWGPVAYSRLALTASRELRLAELRVAGIADVRATSSGAPADVRPALGDGHAVPGLQWGEVRGRARAVAGVDLAVPVRTAFARLRVRTGTATDDSSFRDRQAWITGAQLGALWISPVGAVEFGYGISDRGDRRFDFSIGRRF